jgi:hypothetical protein
VTKRFSPLAADLIEALHEVHDDVTGRKRLFRYPRRIRVTDNLSGMITLDEAGNATMVPERVKNMFVLCIIRTNIEGEQHDLRSR